jgi:hypothetical protein
MRLTQPYVNEQSETRGQIEMMGADSSLDLRKFLGLAISATTSSGMLLTSTWCAKIGCLLLHGLGDRGWEWFERIRNYVHALYVDWALLLHFNAFGTAESMYDHSR